MRKPKSEEHRMKIKHSNSFKSLECIENAARKCRDTQARKFGFKDDSELVERVNFLHGQGLSIHRIKILLKMDHKTISSRIQRTKV
jgi:hypothetical protein